MSSTRETPRSVQLGARLRQYRKRAELTQPQLAERIGRAASHVSRWETGQLRPSEADIGRLAAVLEMSADELDGLAALVRGAGDPNWLAPGIDKQMDALIEYESTADTITEVNPLLIPGLLQTHDYAMAMITGGGASATEARRRTVIRMGRRDVLSSRPVKFDALIGEHALRFPPCDHATMATQLRQVTRCAQWDNVTVRAIPLDTGYSPALDGSFVLFHARSGRSVVQLEHYRSTVALTDAADVVDYKAAVDAIRRDAMSSEATAELIADITDEMESTR